MDAAASSSLSSSLETLPALGVGVSLSFGIEPDPVSLAQAPGGPDFIEYAGAVDPTPVRDAVSALHDLDIPVLYHPSCLNLCGPWENPPTWVAAVDAHVRTVQSAWLAQDVSVCFVGDTPGYSIQLGYFVPPERSEAGLQEAIARVREVRAGVDAPLLLEPAPASFRWGDVPMLTWLDRLCEATGCGMLLDAGHVLSHQFLDGGDPLEQINLERVVEVHVAGGIIHQTPEGPRYQDAHELPIQPEVWDVFMRLLRGCPNLRAVCVECEGASAHTVLPVLERVRQAVAVHAVSDPLRERVRSPERPSMPAAVPARPLPEETPASGATTHFPALLQLLFDAELRGRLPGEATAVAEELEIPRALLEGVDAAGLALDADGRRRYLMSALCRSFPLSAALLGAGEGGPERLATFLTSSELFGSPSERTAAFGRHLFRLASFHPDPDPKAQQAIMAAIEYERALAENAAAVRSAVGQGIAVPPPQPPDRAARRRGRLQLPPFTIITELPQPMAALQAAMEGLTASDAWLRLDRGAVDAARIGAVLRSATSPVTVVARAHTTGRLIERGGSGGVAPLVDVAQRTVELRGRKGRWLEGLPGERVTELPPAQRRLAEGLLQAGVLVVE